MWRKAIFDIPQIVERNGKQGLRLYHEAISQANKKDVHTVDLRSDVLTQPTPEVRKVISEAPVADDVFGECAVTNALQEKVAKLFGMEAALFVPSGTMGNLISVLAHCPQRGHEVLLGDKAHIFLWEQGGISQFGGLHPNIIPNRPDGTFPVEEIDKRLRPNDPHYPISGVICIENTHNYCGGRIMPMEWMKQVKEKASKYNLPVHMDGARVMNAVVALSSTPQQVLQHVDSVSVCMSKGLGAPVGSIIAGTHTFIGRAVRLRKALGGGWRQPGILAAAADYCLDRAEDTLQRDHQNAQKIARALHEHGQDVVSINPKDVHTNILMIDITKPGLTSEQFCRRLLQTSTKETTELQKNIEIKSLPFDNFVRLVLNWNITEDDVEATIDKLKYIIQELK